MSNPHSSDRTLTQAIKEWAVAVAALTAGETILLLRKGGIRERQGRFEVEFDRVLLYPTYEHPKPHLLKPEYAPQITPAKSGWHPQTIGLEAWAHITHIWQVSNPEIVAALEPYHIWNDRFVAERLRWKPQQPLYLLLLRVYRLAETIEIPYRPEYGGCRSWIEIADAISVTEQFPALTDSDYTHKVDLIREISCGKPEFGSQ